MLVLLLELGRLFCITSIFMQNLLISDLAIMNIIIVSFILMWIFQKMYSFFSCLQDFLIRLQLEGKIKNQSLCYYTRLDVV